MAYIVLYVGSLLTLLGMDAVWLSLVAGKLFTKHISHLKGDLLPIPAGLFYVFYAVGLIILVVLPYKDDPKEVFIMGALLGALAYGTYDLTNLATLKNWPIGFAMLDISWGTFVTAVTALITSLIARRLGI